MRSKFILIIACLMTNLFASQAQSQILATAGNAKITVEEFKRRFEETRQAMNPPSAEQFLEDLIRYKIGIQEAEKEKLKNDTLVKERFDQVLYNSLLEKHLGTKVEQIKITEAEMKEFYKINPEFRIAHILIDMKPNANNEERIMTKKRALEVMDDVKKSKRSFEELVRVYSDEVATKEMGGDIGYQSRVTLAPVIYEAIHNMKIGEIKGPIETKFGFHIIKMLDRRTYDMADKRQVRSALFDDKRAKLFNEYFERVKKLYPVEIKKDLLKSLKMGS